MSINPTTNTKPATASKTSPDNTGTPASADANKLQAEMICQLTTYATHAYGQPPRITPTHAVETENALKKIFTLLRTQTSHDFSHYKPDSINRRIKRRMALHQIESIDGYVKFLQQTPPEVETLFHDLLIGVTSFFRDPEAFTVLEEQVIPKLFAGKPAGTVIRIWSTGCSTGEEAYSLAILMQEHMARLKKNFTVQIFATDIDNQAIATARAGLYPASIAANMTPERLARFFSSEPGSNTYRIHKGIRDLLTFSEQNAINDPPLSKLDLISCRNLLISLNIEQQKKLMLLFHYALKPDGMLFLGTAEGVGEFVELFAVLDHTAKIYQRKEDLLGVPRAAMRRSALTPKLDLMHKNRPVFTSKPDLHCKLSLRELTEQTLLQQMVPASALINAQGDILYLHGRTGRYLEPVEGEAGINNMLKMARDGLGRNLSMALYKAVGSKAIVRHPGLKVKTNNHFTLINLTVCPVMIDADAILPSYLYLVILENAPPEQVAQAILTTNTDATAPGSKIEAELNARILALQQELRAKDEYLQATHEELENANEELRTSNEEMQSVNEELKSINEELKTAKEELLSVNEELASVNTKLQTKVLKLSRANNDMNNLLAGTGIGTVFVDHQLRILRFTPTARAIINLIDSDIGRPVAHIVANLLGYDTLVADTQSVLDTLIPKAVDVEARDGKWYTMRILPYRTLDNAIEGAVITFADITGMVQMRETLKQSNSLRRLAIVIRDAFDAVTLQDIDGQILAWNPGATHLYGWSEAEALTMNVRALIPQAQQAAALAKLQEPNRSNILQPAICQRITKNGKVINIWITATVLLNAAGQAYAIATTERGENRLEPRERLPLYPKYAVPDVMERATMGAVPATDPEEALTTRSGEVLAGHGRS